MLDSVEVVDPPFEDDLKAQVDMNLPWRLEYSWEDLVRVWRNARTGELIGPALDSRMTPMTAKVLYVVHSQIVSTPRGVG